MIVLLATRPPSGYLFPACCRRRCRHPLPTRVVQKRTKLVCLMPLPARRNVKRKGILECEANGAGERILHDIKVGYRINPLSVFVPVCVCVGICCFFYFFLAFFLLVLCAYWRQRHTLTCGADVKNICGKIIWERRRKWKLKGRKYKSMHIYILSDGHI